MSTENQRALKRRRHRRAKVRQVLARLEKAGDARERMKAIDKLWKVNPLVVPREHLEKR